MNFRKELIQTPVFMRHFHAATRGQRKLWEIVRFQVKTNNFLAPLSLLLFASLILRGCLHGGRKILEGGTQLFVCFTCRNFGRGGYHAEKEKKNNCWPLAAERPIFRGKVVYRGAWIFLVLGSSYLSARKFLVRGPSTTFCI